MIKYIYIFLDGEIVWSADPPTMEDYASLLNGDLGILKVEVDGTLKEVISFDQEVEVQKAKIEKTPENGRYHTP